MTHAKRGRSWGVLGLLLAGAIGVLSSTQTWLVVARADGGEDILVPGSSALPLLAPLSLAVLALGAALSLAGRPFRYLFALLAAAAAVALLPANVTVMLDAPASAIASAVTEATGLAGNKALESTVDTVTVSYWPALSLFGWIVLLLSAAWVFATAHRWKRSGRRYESPSPEATVHEGPVDSIDSWDDLSRGTDPTEGHR